MNQLPQAQDLIYFQTLCQTLNISVAAKVLGISQPALSVSIRRLEDCLQNPVFIRTKKGLKLTQAGQSLRQTSHELLNQWSEIKTKITHDIQSIKGTVKVGAHTAVAHTTMGGILPEIFQDYPDLQFDFKFDLSRNILQSILQLEVDLGIVVNPQKHPDLVLTKLGQDEFTFWTGKSHRSIQNWEDKSAVFLGNFDLIQTQKLIKAASKQGVQVKRFLHIGDLNLIAQWVLQGAGIGLLPQRVAQAISLNQLIRIRHSPKVNDEIYLVYRVENKSNPLIKVVVNKIKDNF